MGQMRKMLRRKKMKEGKKDGDKEKKGYGKEDIK